MNGKHGCSLRQSPLPVVTNLKILLVAFSPSRSGLSFCRVQGHDSGGVVTLSAISHVWALCELGGPHSHGPAPRFCSLMAPHPLQGPFPDIGTLQSYSGHS